MLVDNSSVSFVSFLENLFGTSCRPPATTTGFHRHLYDTAGFCCTPPFIGRIAFGREPWGVDDRTNTLVDAVLPTGIMIFGLRDWIGAIISE